MPGRLDGKVAIVVGAGASGPGLSIGRATALVFAREGARVLAVDRDEAAAVETVRMIEDEGGAAAARAADATDPDQIAAAVDVCLDRFGGLDILDNNVGVMAFGDPVALDVAEWDRVMTTNGRSQFLPCKYALPHLIAGGGGAIVNISSIAGIRWTGAPYHVYSASKAATIGFTRALALDYADRGVRVNCVVPGFIESPMMRGGVAERLGPGAVEDAVAARAAALPMRRFGSPWDVAKACAFLASDDAAYITGASLVVDGGVTLSCAIP
jgi:NAD(P)-dependent dehydrogenase (short-subunit alcohol dehydrogenase family)